MNSLFKINESKAWSLIGVITILASLFFFLGPETHSEVEGSSTIVDKALDTLFVFLISSSILLPIGNIKDRKIINISIVLIGLVLFLFKLIVGLYIVAVVNKSLIGSFIAVCVLLFFCVFFYKKYDFSCKNVVS